MRDNKGRFIKGHKPIGDMLKKALEHNKKFGNWNKGLTKETDERVLKISKITGERMKGKHLSEETKKKMSLKHKGKIVSIETRKKLSESNKGRIISKETRDKISKSNKGKKLSKETKELMSKNNKKHFLGKKHSEETKHRMSESRKGKIPWNKGIEYFQIKGEKHPNWKGGVTSINEKIRKSLEYNLWKKAVIERDNYTCIWCGEIGGNLNADHIKPFSLFPELRFAIDNGRTLCIDCHKKTETYGGRYLRK